MAKTHPTAAGELRAGDAVQRMGKVVRLARDPEPHESHPHLVALPLYGTGESENVWIMRADRQVQRVEK